VRRFSEFEAAVDLVLLQVTAHVNPEMALLLALIVYDGYELFPAHDCSQVETHS
jgi:hypothetical protein